MRSAGWMEQSWSPNTNFISTSDRPRTAEPHVCRIASRWEKWSLADNTPKMSRFDGTFAVNHYVLQYQESWKNNCYCLHTLNWSGSPATSLQGNTDSWLNSWLHAPFIQPISSNGYGRWGEFLGQCGVHCLGLLLAIQMFLLVIYTLFIWWIVPKLHTVSFICLYQYFHYHLCTMLQYNGSKRKKKLNSSFVWRLPWTESPWQYLGDLTPWMRPRVSCCSSLILLLHFLGFER